MDGKSAGKVQLVQTMLRSTVFCVGIEIFDGKKSGKNSVSYSGAPFFVNGYNGIAGVKM
jgi:hypothetical protein